MAVNEEQLYSYTYRIEPELYKDFASTVQSNGHKISRAFNDFIDDTLRNGLDEEYWDIDVIKNTSQNSIVRSFSVRRTKIDEFQRLCSSHGSKVSGVLRTYIKMYLKEANKSERK